MAILIRSFRTRGVYANLQAFRRKVTTELSTKFLPVLKRYTEALTRPWAGPPEWRTGTRVNTEGIFVSVWPDGPNAFKWRLLDQGVQGRWQRVRRSANVRGYKPAIRFYRYRPFTQPGPRFGGPGTYHGAPIFTNKPYWWPGIRARHLNESVRIAMLPEFRRRAESAARAGIRAAVREGT